MHSCKGLEYKVVFIMDVVEGIIPYNKAVLDYGDRRGEKAYVCCDDKGKRKVVSVIC